MCRAARPNSSPSGPPQCWPKTPHTPWRQRRKLTHTGMPLRTSELSDGAIDLAVERDAPAADEPVRAQGGDAALRDLLTRRELDVLEHMVRGETNADIARALVVSEGTVKFHVKNILRKLHAANRAEATSRYLRLTMRHEERSLS